VKGIAQVILGTVAAVVSISIILGAFLLSFLESEKRISLDRFESVSGEDIEEKLSTPSPKASIERFTAIYAEDDLATLMNDPTNTPSMKTPSQPTSADQFTSTVCSPPNGWVVYTVKANDTVESLSEDFNVSEVNLRSANCLESDTKIFDGLSLYVPRIAIHTVTSTATATVKPTSTTIATPTRTKKLDNNPPQANPQLVTTSSGQQVRIELVGIDPDNDKLTYIIVSKPRYGDLGGTSPHLVYIPFQTHIGFDNFTFKVSDGFLDSQIVTVDIIITP
jgi:LysM repeat protein